MSELRRLFLTSVFIFACAVAPQARAGEAADKLTTFPETLSKSCRNGKAKVYDQCGDQLKLLVAAADRAAAEHKVLLVTFGSEWCIWCHVFDAYVHGGKDKFSYTFGSPKEPEKRNSATLYERARSDVSAEAEALQSFVAKSFVVLHVDSQYAPNGAEVIRKTGADKFYKSSIPFIFTVGADNKIAAAFDEEGVETRRDTNDWYRGYDRRKLLTQLTAMRDAALKGAPN